MLLAKDLGARILGMKIPVQRLDPELPLPQRSHPGDAGIDLYARETCKLESGERTLMPTGIAVAVPDGHVGLVSPRSGLAIREGLSVVNGPGIVDSGYRGELKVVLVNLGQEPIAITRSDRIAQLVITPVLTSDVEEVDELPTTSRGAGGFGSTGS